MIPEWVTTAAFMLLAPFAVLAWRRTELALMVSLASLSAYAIRTSIAGIPTTWLELSLYAVALVTFVQSGRDVIAVGAQWWRRYRIWVVAGLVWVVAACIGTAVAKDTRIALGVLKGWVADPLLAGMLVGYYAERSRDTLSYWRGVLLSLLIGAALTSLAALAQSWLLGWPRVASGSDSPNVLAMYLTPIALGAAAWWRLSATRALLATPGWKGWWLALTSLTLVTILLTDSYAAYLVLAAGLLAIAFSPFAAAGKLMKYFGTAVMAVGLALPFVLAGSRAWQLPGHTNETYNVTSGEVRQVIWREATALGKASPVFGLGLGQFKGEFLARAEGAGLLSIRNPGLAIELAYASLFPHNLWLATWLQTGALGVLVLLFIGWLVFVQPGRLLLASIPAIMLLGIYLHGVVDTPLWRNDLAIVWVIVVLASAGLSRSRLGSTMGV